MFRPTLAVAGAGVSNACRPRLPIRLMVALLCLEHAYNESDESLVVRWSLPGVSPALKSIKTLYFQLSDGTTLQINRPKKVNLCRNSLAVVVMS